MQSKILSKRILLPLVILSGLTLFTSLLFYFIPQSSSQSGSIPLTANAATHKKTVNSGLVTSQVGLPTLLKISSLNVDTPIDYVGLTSNLANDQAGLPKRLKISSINVDAPIEYVGLTPDGAMDVPKDIVNVGWFNLGPRPGGNGSAVIAGHYGTTNNIPHVFDNLHNLHKDDKIYIEDEGGKNIIFVVREIQKYGKNQDSSGIFGSSDGKAHLNLITCTGVWNQAEKTFSERLVVFTDKE